MTFILHNIPEVCYEVLFSPHIVDTEIKHQTEEVIYRR